MIINQIDLSGNRDLIKRGLSPVMLVVRDTNGKSVYDLNNEKILNGKLMLESHYFIKKDGSILKIRDEDMCTELDKEIFNKHILLVDIEGDFNVETMDHTRGNSLIELVTYIRNQYKHINKIVPYHDIYPDSKTPGSNFPVAYINELINNDDTYYIKVNKNSASTNPYLPNKTETVYKTRKLFINSPYLSGSDVSTLKYKLAELGFELNVSTDVYDESVVSVINMLRHKLGLPQNGIATIDLMEEIDAMLDAMNSKGDTAASVKFTRIITLTTPYTKGIDVRQVQMILKANGFYNGDINDIYDVNTSDAVKSFQDANNIEVNGIITLDVWKKLSKLSVAKFTRLIYVTIPNMTGDDILMIQNRLLALGYSNTELSGIYDIHTENIIKEFQKNNSLKADGKITKTVFNELFK